MDYAAHPHSISILMHFKWLFGFLCCFFIFRCDYNYYFCIRDFISPRYLKRHTWVCELVAVKKSCIVSLQIDNLLRFYRFYYQFDKCYIGTKFITIQTFYSNGIKFNKPTKRNPNKPTTILSNSFYSLCFTVGTMWSTQTHYGFSTIYPINSTNHLSDSLFTF